MSRRKKVVNALGELFAVKPRARSTPRRLPSQNPLAVRMERAALPALPAPPKPLALPPPDPRKALPPLAAKPRGGQWWTEKMGEGFAPEAVARKQAEQLSPSFYSTDELLADLATDAAVPTPSTAQAVQEWLARSLAKYYKTDFGSPEDPLRDLAARGLHYDVDMTPERWSELVNDYLMEDRIGDVLLPRNFQGGMPGAGSDLRGQTMVNMPWLAKQPVTDSVYGIGRGGLNLEHFADEFANALNPQASGIPADLAVRPESLARMSFPQAVERVGRINQFRAKQMAEQANVALNNPAIQTFKEYPDAGYRWVELRAPDFGDEMPPGYRMSDPVTVEDGRQVYEVLDPRGAVLADYFDPEEALRMTQKDAASPFLRDALRFEGDTMGHCVGGYCDDVLSGRSRIFSLRDAKGQPHVTIETAPKKDWIKDLPSEIARQLWRESGGNARRYNQLGREYLEAQGAVLPDTQDIIQIKGKQNRAPVEDYLPYVQDFVKSGTWGNIGDFGNTGLVKLPDGRFITQDQYAEGVRKALRETEPGWSEDWYAGQERAFAARPGLNPFNGDAWSRFAPFFEGFAIGGRVSKDRCFSRHPMSVR